MKLDAYFTTVLTGPILGLLLSMPAYAQRCLPVSSVIVKQNTSDADTSLSDLNLDCPPLSSKYAHGLKAGPVFHNMLPRGPIAPKANELYFEAQDLQQKGFAYLMYQHPEQAIVNLNKARLLWPDSAKTYRWLAEAYEANGQTQEAIANYRLLFYGWPGKYIPSIVPINNTQPKKIPADKPSDYDQSNPEETDPTLLLRFSLLLQQIHQYAEAQAVYDRGVQALTVKFADNEKPLPSLASVSIAIPTVLEAETRTALAIDQISYRDKADAQDNLKQALNLQPDLTVASYYQSQIARNQTTK